MEPGGDSFCLLHSIWAQLRRSEGQALPCWLGAGSLRSDAGCQLGPQLGGCWNTYICDLFVKFFCAGTFGLLHNVAGYVLSVGFPREQEKGMVFLWLVLEFTCHLCYTLSVGWNSRQGFPNSREEYIDPSLVRRLLRWHYKSIRNGGDYCSHLWKVKPATPTLIISRLKNYLEEIEGSKCCFPIYLSWVSLEYKWIGWMQQWKWKQHLTLDSTTSKINRQGVCGGRCGIVTPLWYGYCDAFKFVWLLELIRVLTHLLSHSILPSAFSERKGH